MKPSSLQKYPFLKSFITHYFLNLSFHGSTWWGLVIWCWAVVHIRVATPVIFSSDGGDGLTVTVAKAEVVIQTVEFV